MIIEPKVRGFICTTAHPAGCQANVVEQIHAIKQKPQFSGCKNALIIGASTGYGLASRIAAAFGAGAATLGVIFEKGASDKRTATAGWYNTAAFEQQAKHAKLYAKTINGDAFSDAIKKQAIEIIKQDLGKIDLVIYSLASPRRTHPVTGVTHSAVLKTVGAPFANKTVNTMTGEITTIEIPPATDEEINNTIAVMGGEDWELWIEALREANVLTPNVTTVAYSYIGPLMTYPIYHHGTIGLAKQHLEKTAKAMHQKLSYQGGRALVAVNKAVVTQSSAAIPIVPLYISLLFKVMKQQQIHEGCIEQIYRLFHEHLYGNSITDSAGRIRLDDLEMREDVQNEVSRRWQQISTDNLANISDIEGYRQEFYKLFGFGIQSVNYQKEVDPVVAIPSIGVE
jgi:enoyl-[acyl-carrier protein] reductase/trans-2-enoyl-CoA reductase (NAD+)